MTLNVASLIGFHRSSKWRIGLEDGGVFFNVNIWLWEQYIITEYPDFLLVLYKSFASVIVAAGMR